MQVIKKDGRLVDFNGVKIVEAIRKSADRVMVELTGIEEEIVCKEAYDMCAAYGEQVPVVEVHKFVENALLMVNPKVAESYRSYRNYKTNFVKTMDEIYAKSQSILYVGDKENSNADSALVSTKQSLVRGEVSKELYKTFFLTPDEVKAVDDGFIYVHDMRDRMYTFNCCLFDVSTVMQGGFEMGNVWYNEPKTLDVACDVLGDIIMSSASQQYGK